MILELGMRVRIIFYIWTSRFINTQINKHTNKIMNLGTEIRLTMVRGERIGGWVTRVKVLRKEKKYSGTQTTIW